MLPTLLVTFRESLEASLVVVIILSYLIKTGRGRYSKVVFQGVTYGIAASLAVALLFSRFAGGLEGVTEAIFEGSTMLVASLLISSLLIWAMKHSNTSHRIKKDVDVALDKRQEAGLLLLAFVAVFREGVETVLFLAAVSFSGGLSLFGGLLGMTSAVAVGYLFFVTSGKLNLKIFFFVTGIMLLLFSAGLFASFVHEFQEAGVISVLVQEAWNTEHILSERGFAGSIMKSLLGYNANPSVLEVVAYLSYIAFVGFVYYKVNPAKNIAALVKR